MEILIGIICLAVGVGVGVLILRGRVTALNAEVGKYQQELELQKQEIESRKQELERQKGAVAASREKIAELEATMRTREENAAELQRQQERHHKEELEAMAARFDETIAKMSQEVRNVTSEMLRQRQEEFSKSSGESLNNILHPLEISLKAMREAVNDNTTKHTELGGTLNANIGQLLKQSEAARLSADRLANALRNNGRVQGNWGETILTELLESNGLKEGRHFDVQAPLYDETGTVIKNDSGHSMRPDVVLHLDHERDVIIDSKVSLTAYLDYVNSDNDTDRERALQEHVMSLKRHVRELVEKKYWEHPADGKVTVGYVIMFVPSTAALYAATDRDRDLWRKAMEQGVYIADEQTLYAALKIVALTWRQIMQADNHQRVYQLADEMLNRVGQFMEKYVAIGKSIAGASKAYDEGLAKLSPSGQSIPVTCNKLIRLGAQVQKRKNVPPQLTGSFDETDNLITS